MFCLKTGIDYFKHGSSEFFAVFLDFRDAFGTLAHNVMITALEEFHLPQVYVDIVKDVYLRRNLHLGMQTPRYSI